MKTKFIVLVPDGMADYPLKELNYKTPLEIAKTPNLDRLAREGQIGLSKNVPGKMTPGSDVAILSLLGYNPFKYYTGRGPLEAASHGIKLSDEEAAFRCNLVTVDHEFLTDYSAGHIQNQEGSILMEMINKKLGNKDIRFYPGVSYRNLMVAKIKVFKPDPSGHDKLKEKFFKKLKKEKSAAESIKCYPPHDILNQPYKEFLPQGEKGALIRELTERSKDLLEKHDVNRVRIDLGENPANMIWLWGQGGRPKLPSFWEKHTLRGGVISAVDLIKGLGRYLGLKVIEVPGATGYYDTNYEGKAEAALACLAKTDFVFVHVEAPDEAGHNGDIVAKIKTIEDFDRRLLGRILAGLEKFRRYRVMVLPDHPTPIALRTHTRDAVPFVIWGSEVKKNNFAAFSEKMAQKSSIHFHKGYNLMPHFINLKGGRVV